MVRKICSRAPLLGSCSGGWLYIISVRLGMIQEIIISLARRHPISYCAPDLGGGHSGIARSNIRHIRLPVPWRSCLGYRHTGCLQLSHRWSPEMCGLRTRPRMDVDPPRFLPPSNCHRRGAYRLAAPGAIPCSNTNLNSDSV